ncbi:MAG: lipopolysaccharide kinase InaA family protein [Desulfuromonadales bacterium]
MTGFVAGNGVLCAADAVPVLQQAGLLGFDDFMNFAGGTRVVHKRGRSVYRFEAAGRAFYLKRNHHHPVEVCKALGRLRLPQLGARIEWENILAVQAAGIPTVRPIALGTRCCCGIETASFTVTEELYGAEPLDIVWRRDFPPPRSKPQVAVKGELLRRLAALARNFHHSGMNHQDFYLNHFFVGEGGMLYLLDLQRVQRRDQTPRRCVIKDLAQLNYSSRVYGGFSNADRLRFLEAYISCSGRLDPAARQLIRDIHIKTERIARHDRKLLVRRRRRGELP